MKKILYILAILICNYLYSQTNLVPNPGFESYTNCPTNTDQMSFCSAWSSFNSSPDYYNTCGSPGLAPPNSSFGYQWPHQGNSYAGLVTFFGPTSNYREIIGAALTSTLQIGTRYYFSFFANMAGTNYKIATNKICIRFSTIPFSTITPVPINNFSQYYSTSVISDTVNWVQLKGSFVSDSLYKFIMLGNFFDDTNTSTVSIGAGNQSSYYYIDDLCLSTDSIYNSTWTGLRDKQSNLASVIIYPNPTANQSIFKFSSRIPEKIELYNNLGNLVFEKIINSRDSQVSIDLSCFSSGVYNASFVYDNAIEAKKLIIIKP